MSTLPLVVIESPLAGDFARNVRYARLALVDSLRRGEAPFASHLLYTQALDDELEADRDAGMAAGFAWGERADLCAVYQDLGVSRGMRAGIERAEAHGTPIVYRRLPVALLDQLAAVATDLRPTVGIR